MRPLIVLGASVRAAAFSAIRAGFAPYAIDTFADLDLAALCPAAKIARYPGEFLQALAAAPEAPWLYTGGLENHPRLVDRLAEIRPLLGNGGSVLRRVRDPQYLAKAVQAAGLPFPKTASSGADATTDRTWLVKPRRSGGGLGIRFATAGDFTHLPRGAYLEEHIAGEAASAVFVAAGRQATLVGMTRQLLGRDFSLTQPFLYAGTIGPLTLREIELASVQALGHALAREFDLAGLFNVDFVRTKENLWPLEVNPRYSSSVEVLERAAGIDCVGWHVAACETAGLPEQPLFMEMAMHGKAIVYAPRDAIVATRFDALVDEWNQPGVQPLIADLPRVGESLRTGQPVATVFAQANTVRSVELELHARVAAVHAVL
jgi:predicted ATP-grasp superfamily ATP-dependent carboligase